MSNNFWVAGDLDHTIDYGQRALALAATLGHVSLQARTLWLLGQSTACQTHPEVELAVGASLAMARAMYQAMEMTFWLPVTEVALAQGAGQ